MRNCVVSIVVTTVFTTSRALSEVTFIDVTTTAGVDYIQHQLPAREERQTYMSGGAAAADFNRDGWVDLYVTRLDNTDVLFQNNKDGTFSDVTAIAFGPEPPNLPTNGAQSADIDNDGDQDLYVTALETNQFFLYINDGSGRFHEQALTRGAALAKPDEHFGFSAAFGDFDRDGYLDLHTTEWRLKYQNRTGAPFNSRLLRNRGASQPGHFLDVTETAGVLMETRSSPDITVDAQSFASRFTDLDSDGHSDLIVASDHLTSGLFWNNGDGTFTDGTMASGVGTDQFGMGSTVGDYDGDGDLDWFVTSIFKAGEERMNGNRLYRNEGRRKFSDATDEAGVRDGGWGWGASFFDFDNDGDLDIAQTNGIEWPILFYSTYREFKHDISRLWQNDGTGKFTEIGASVGITDTASGKGLLTLDYDRDGDLDLFITNNQGHPVLYRNDGGNDKNWLRIATQGRLSNREGIGALITIVPDLSDPEQLLLHEIDGGSNFLGQNERIAHFGLDDRVSVDLITIQWPSGQLQHFTDVAGNTTLQAVETVPAPSQPLGLLALLAVALLSRCRRKSKTNWDFLGIPSIV